MLNKIEQAAKQKGFNEKTALISHCQNPGWYLLPASGDPDPTFLAGPNASTEEVVDAIEMLHADGLRSPQVSESPANKIEKAIKRFGSELRAGLVTDCEAPGWYVWGGSHTGGVWDFVRVAPSTATEAEAAKACRH